MISLLPLLLQVISAYSSISGHPYIRNGPDGSGSRAPCPGLNTLANHGFLPRNGRNITRQQLIDAMEQGYSLSPSLGSTLADIAFDTVGRKNQYGAEYIDLEFLDVPAKYGKGLEHDVSLSRSDCPDHNCVIVNTSMVEDLISYGGPDGISSNQLMQYRQHVECDISRLSGNFSYSVKSRIAAAGEAAIFVAIFGAYKPVKENFTRTFFLEERLPFEEGWEIPNETISMWNWKFSSLLAKLTGIEVSRRC